jgi:predicted RNA-binding Zn ribbon-like protein
VSFDEAADGLTLELRFDDGEQRSPLGGATADVPGLAARMLALAHDAMTDGTWDRLKACGNTDECAWVFFDRSKNHSRVWCDMTTCGAEAKSRAFRARQRERRARAERSS